MIKKIDVNSVEFQNELKKTIDFTKEICEKFGFEFNPEEEINEGIKMGLTRNKMIYGEYYCPCFMVEGETKEQREKANNRLCPCTPALNEEIPTKGHCHCGIFCTKGYVQKHKKELKIDEVTHSHSRGLSKDECEMLLQKAQLDGDEIESLLEARELGMVEFKLVDVREWMEWLQHRIQGTDFLVPTTSFYASLQALEEFKNSPIILYCLTGSRSAYCQQAMRQLGFKQVSNFRRGIVSYRGELVSGE